MFSKTCQYALQAILYISLHSDDFKPVGLKAISKAQEIPHFFLSKILQDLVRQKILNSIKGPNGGFFLNKSADKLSLHKIVEIIDGPDIFDRCGIGLKKCSDKSPCPIHFEYKQVKEKIKHLLNEKTVAELCEDIKNGHSIVNYKTT